MRVSSQQIFLQNIANISDLNAQTQRLQEQIASGERLQSSADDPVAATRILQIEAQLANSGQYLENIELAESRLQLIESSLTSVEESVLRVRELVIQAGNGALSNENRAAIAVEIEERLTELTDLANTRDRDGDYIFGGFQVDQEPFVAVGDSYQYRGDEGVRLVQVSNSAYVAISESGEDLFANIPVVNQIAQGAATASNSSSVSVNAVEVADQALYDAVYPEDFVISFNAPGAIAPAGPNYTITRRSDGVVVAANQPYDAAAGISFNGLVVSLSGTPAPGDQFTVDSTQSRDMLSTVAEIAADIDSFTDTTERDAFIADALNNLDNIQDSLLRGRSRIGARLNTVDSSRDSLEAGQLNNQEILSEIRDLDYAEAVSNLTFLTFVLEATQQSFVRVSGLSLFNFLR